ncbi:hypothetical protein OY671_008841, partial [Metschnikowia pulcherrima]
MARKAIFITGGASGIGRAVAQRFGREGWFVGIADINEAGMAETAALSPAGASSIHKLDVRDRAAWDAASADFARAAGGGIDVVFNNAGAGGDRATTDAIEPAGCDRTMDSSSRSVAFRIRYAVPHMIGPPGAAIVNTSSVAAVGPGYSPTAYAVAKAGVSHSTKCAAADLAKHQIRVNAVQPGFINTNIFTRSSEMPAESEAQAKGAIAM